MSAERSRPGWSARSAVWLFAPLVATALALLPSLGNGYTMDDRLIALGVNDAGQPNPRIFERQPLAVYFTTSWWADTRSGDTLYRPLPILTFALRHRLFGDAAWPEHAANLLLHLAATALVWALLRRLVLPPPAAAAGAAVFGLHAIHSEVVATVVGRAELLAFVGGALATLLFAKALDTAGRRSWPTLLGSALSLLVALLSKESAVGWVAVLPAFACAAGWRQRESGALERPALVRLLLRSLAVALPPLVVFFLLRQQMIGRLAGPPEPILYLVNPIADAAWPSRVATATVVLLHGLLLTAAPFRLAADYGAEVFPVLASLADWRFVAATLLLGALCWHAWRRRRQHPELFLAALVFFALIAVASNLLLPIGTIFGERLYYAPSLALALVAAWAVRVTAAHTRSHARSALLVGLGAWLGASTLVLVERQGVWRDDATLFLHEAERQPRSARLQVTAATVRQARGELETAARHLERALAIEPGYALAWNNLAALRLEQGRLADAETAARRGLAARHLQRPDDEFKLECNLGLTLLARGDAAGGADRLAACLAAEPGFLRPWNELRALVAAGHLPPATLDAVLARGEARSPGSPWWPLYRGLLAHGEGRLAEAADRLSPALAAAPRRGPWAATWAEGALARADALLRLGRVDEGRALLRDLAADRFTPPAPREVASQALARLDG